MSNATDASTAVMTNHEAFTVASAPLQTLADPSQPPQLEQNMLVPYEDPTYRAETSSQYIPPGSVLIKHVNPYTGDHKRKRGRPRKYGVESSSASGKQPISVDVPQNFSPTSQQQTEFQTPVSGTRASGMPVGETPVSGSMTSATVKKVRGRPPGSTNKKEQKEDTDAIDTRMRTHIINVNVGEDVASKIMAFSQHTPRAVCILSANGAISNVTLREPESSGGIVIYEGRYDIVNINGSFMLSNAGGPRSRTGGIGITLCGPGREIIGGCVAGFMLAATPVLVVLGSFDADEPWEPKSASQMEPSSAPPRANQLGGASSESSGGAASPFSGVNSNIPQGMQWS